MTVDAMRAEVVKSEALTTMKAELVEAGLLLSDAAARLLRWRWLIGAALVTLGVARLWAGVNIGEPVEFLLVMVLVALYTTQEMFRSNPPATRHGQAIVDRWRAECGWWRRLRRLRRLRWLRRMSRETGLHIALDRWRLWP